MATNGSPAARAVQRQVFAAMTGEERVQSAVEMSESAKEIALEGIRSRNPNFTEAEVKRAWFIQLHGEELTGLLLAPSTAER